MTADGGASWSGPESAPCLGQATFQGDFGYAGSATGAPALYVTGDGGQTWTSGRLPVAGTEDAGTWTGGVEVLALRRRADGKLRAIAMWPPFNGTPTMIESSDGGGTWTAVDGEAGLRPLPQQVVALSDDRWLAIDRTRDDHVTGTIFSSNDGGLNWQQADAFVDVAFQLDFLNATDGWLVTTTYVADDQSPVVPFRPDSSIVYATTDGGATWTQIFTTWGLPAGSPGR